MKTATEVSRMWNDVDVVERITKLVAADVKFKVYTRVHDSVFLLVWEQGWRHVKPDRREDL